MGVNKNIDELKKELENMHKMFDNILSDKKQPTEAKGANNKTLIKDNKEVKTEDSLSKNPIPKKETTINTSSLSSEKLDTFQNNIKNKLSDETAIAGITDKIENSYKTQSENEEISVTEKNANLDDITFSFNDDSKIADKTNSKVINLYKKEQYLSIREKLEKIKNEIKQKELELKNKK